jgi:uncharacterized protein
MSSPSVIKSRIQEEMKAAMRAQYKKRLDVLRLILAAAKQIEVDERIELDDPRMLTILAKMVKQRNDSITQYKAGNRPDLVEQEEFEVSVIQEFLPSQLADAEIENLIKETINNVGAKSIQDMGKVMNDLKPKIQGRADMGVVSNKIKQLLAG